MRRKLQLFISLTACSTLFFACSSSDDEADEFTLNGTNIAMTDIAGNWNATRGVFQSSSLGPSFQVDVVDEGGTITMNIQSNGQFSITVTVPGRSP